MAIETEIFPQPLTVAEQGQLDRQAFMCERSFREERRSYELLDHFASQLAHEYSWMKTDNQDEKAELARALREINQHQNETFIEKVAYPTGVDTYRALQRRYVKTGGTAVVVAEALMGGDTRNGSLPILAHEAINPAQ